MLFQRRHEALQLRREQLAVRGTELRMQLAVQAGALTAPLAWADRAIDALRTLRSGVDWLLQRPEVPIGALLLTLALRPRRVLRWGSRLWWGWRMWTRAQRILRSVPLR